MAFRRFPAVAALLCTAAMLCDCAAPAPKYIFEWGASQSLVYADYADPGSVGYEQKVQVLEATIAAAKKSGHLVAPGVHAQLGYVFAQANKPYEARAQFRAEEKLFPESKTFMDRLIARLPVPSDDPQAEDDPAGAAS